MSMSLSTSCHHKTSVCSQCYWQVSPWNAFPERYTTERPFPFSIVFSKYIVLSLLFSFVYLALPWKNEHRFLNSYNSALCHLINLPIIWKLGIWPLRDELSERTAGTCLLGHRCCTWAAYTGQVTANSDESPRRTSSCGPRPVWAVKWFRKIF